jgi:hypothetical protein
MRGEFFHSVCRFFGSVQRGEESFDDPAARFEVGRIFNQFGFDVMRADVGDVSERLNTLFSTNEADVRAEVFVNFVSISLLMGDF